MQILSSPIVTIWATPMEHQRPPTDRHCGAWYVTSPRRRCHYDFSSARRTGSCARGRGRAITRKGTPSGPGLCRLSGSATARTASDSRGRRSGWWSGRPRTSSPCFPAGPNVRQDRRERRAARAGLLPRVRFADLRDVDGPRPEGLEPSHRHPEPAPPVEAPDTDLGHSALAWLGEIDSIPERETQ